jgi:hypothetical protein
MPDSMRRVLLDENLPGSLRRLITHHDVRTVRYMGWSGLDNGRLIAAAESNGFHIMPTADRAMPHQQNLSGRHLAVIVPNDKAPPVLRRSLTVVIRAIDMAQPGTFTMLTLRGPPTPRRPPSVSPGS